MKNQFKNSSLFWGKKGTRIEAVIKLMMKKMTKRKNVKSKLYQAKVISTTPVLDTY